MQHHEGVVEHVGEAGARLAASGWAAGVISTRRSAPVGDQFDLGAPTVSATTPIPTSPCAHGHDDFRLVCSSSVTLTCGWARRNSARSSAGSCAWRALAHSATVAHAGRRRGEVGVHLFELGEDLSAWRSSASPARSSPTPRARRTKSGCRGRLPAAAGGGWPTTGQKAAWRRASGSRLRNGDEEGRSVRL